LYVIKGIAILDNDGNRIFAKYYDANILGTVKEQKAFEKNLFNKTHRSNDEIIMLDGLTCLYRSNVDLFFYVMGLSSENEVYCIFHILDPSNCCQEFKPICSLAADPIEYLTMFIRIFEPNSAKERRKAGRLGQSGYRYVSY